MNDRKNKYRDIRVIEHLLRHGDLYQSELQEHLDNLEDDAEEGVETETRFSSPWADRARDPNGAA